jgi:glycosyltransferase involved in cell wall biosynthesis
MTEACPPDLSVIVLCYRAGQSASAIVADLQRVLEAGDLAHHQIVLVGNHRPNDLDDPTPRVVRELTRGDPRIVCSAVEKQGMMGWDLRCGLQLATGRVLAVIDGDGQIVPQDVVRGYRALLGANLDLVQARRRSRQDGPRRWLLSRGFNLIFRLLFPGAAAHDVNGKPKLMTRAAYERLDLRSDDWFIDAEILLQARRLEFRRAEFDTDFLGLAGRRSFVNLRTVAEFVANLARFRLRGRL